MSSRYNLTDLVGAVSPPVAAVTTAVARREEAPAIAKRVLTHRVLPGVVVGAAGAYFWKKHRVLGFLTGMAVGDNAYRLYKGDERKGAFADIGAAGAGVAGALAWKKHPVLGWLGGTIAGSLASSFVEGSTAYKIRNRV